MPQPLPSGSQPFWPLPPPSLFRELLGWGRQSGLKSLGRRQLEGGRAGQTLPGSSLTVACVEKQLHLLPQRPDDVTVTVWKAKGSLLSFPGGVGTQLLTQVPVLLFTKKDPRRHLGMGKGGGGR